MSKVLLAAIGTFSYRFAMGVFDTIPGLVVLFTNHRLPARTSHPLSRMTDNHCFCSHGTEATGETPASGHRVHPGRLQAAQLDLDALPSNAT